MTRVMACAVLLLVMVWACGGGDAQPTTPAAGGEPATEGTPAGGPTGCEKEVALSCADGFTDGCLSKLTLVHVCVAASEEKAGAPPCEQEIARQCPEGQMDACLATPAMAANHVCVVAPPK